VRLTHPCRCAGGARVGLGVLVLVLVSLAAGRAAAEEGKLPVPWPTTPEEVIPYGQGAEAVKKPVAPGGPPGGGGGPASGFT
jgi:hypothetical protein